MKRLKCCMGFICPYYSKICAQFQSTGIICRIILCLLICQYSFAQETLLQNNKAQNSVTTLGQAVQIPEKVFSSVDKKATGLEEKITRQSIKYLHSLERQEARIQSKLKMGDSLAMKSLYAGYSEIQKWEQKIKHPLDEIGGKGKTYIPLLDSITTSLKFLQYSNINSSGQLSQINQSLAQLNSLQGKLDQVGQFQSFLKDRKQFIEGQLMNLGMFKELRHFREGLYYYQARMEEYRHILDDPDKVISTALNIMNRIPAFKEFFRNNSALSSLFNIPGSSTPANPLPIAGLQTRSMVAGLMQQQLGTGGPNVQGAGQQNLLNAQSQLSSIKNQIIRAGGNSSETNLPDGFRPNNQKTRSFLNRLEYGITMQSQRATNYFPVTSDLGMTIGYKLNDKSIVGLGTGMKIGWGKNWQNISLSSQGVSLKSFIDWKLKGNLYVSGGYEQNYWQQIKKLSQFNHLTSWQQSGLIGLKKSVSMKGTVLKKASMSVLWDFLSYYQIPRMQPFVFRFGYGF